MDDLQKLKKLNFDEIYIDNKSSLIHIPFNFRDILSGVLDDLKKTVSTSYEFYNLFLVVDIGKNIDFNCSSPKYYLGAYLPCGNKNEDVFVQKLYTLSIKIQKYILQNCKKHLNLLTVMKIRADLLVMSSYGENYIQNICGWCDNIFKGVWTDKDGDSLLLAEGTMNMSTYQECIKFNLYLREQD